MRSVLDTAFERAMKQAELSAAPPILGGSSYPSTPDSIPRTPRTPTDVQAIMGSRAARSEAYRSRGLKPHGPARLRRALIAELGQTQSWGSLSRAERRRVMRRYRRSRLAGDLIKDMAAFCRRLTTLTAAASGVGILLVVWGIGVSPILGIFLAGLLALCIWLGLLTSEVLASTIPASEVEARRDAWIKRELPRTAFDEMLEAEERAQRPPTKNCRHENYERIQMTGTHGIQRLCLDCGTMLLDKQSTTSPRRLLK